MAAFGATSPIAHAAPAAASPSVRVNQVGYPAAGTKRAYLMTPAGAAGATFSVRNASGAAVFSGAVPPSLGSWSTAYPFVHPLDFDAVAAPGTRSVASTPAARPSSRRAATTAGAASRA
jgi:endoglucanase